MIYLVTETYYFGGVSLGAASLAIDKPSWKEAIELLTKIVESKGGKMESVGEDKVTYSILSDGCTSGVMDNKEIQYLTEENIKD